MANIIRGTTPTLTFTIPFTVDEISVFYITFKDSQGLILEKSAEDDNVEIDGNKITVTLTQNETLKFKSIRDEKCKFQIRIRLIDGTAVASKIYTASVDGILKDGVI